MMKIADTSFKQPKVCPKIWVTHKENMWLDFFSEQEGSWKSEIFAKKPTKY